MSKTTSDEKERQTKAIWDDVTVDSFINVCVTETLNGHRPRGYFTKIGWRNVVKNFYEKTGRNYGYKQLKNKWTTLKRDWQVWNDLIGNEKEIGWDPLRQTIDATSQWWDHKLKVIFHGSVLILMVDTSLSPFFLYFYYRFFLRQPSFVQKDCKVWSS